MIEHILLWQFTEQAKAEGAAEKLAYLQRRFAALPGRIEGLHRLRLLPNVNGGPYDLALIAELIRWRRYGVISSIPCIWISSRRRKAG